MSNRNQMPGLRLKGGIWQIEKRCKHCESGWLRESTGTSRRAEAEEILIRRLAELRAEAARKAESVFTFEEAALRYLEDVAHKSSADTRLAYPRRPLCVRSETSYRRSSESVASRSSSNCWKEPRESA